VIGCIGDEKVMKRFILIFALIVSGVCRAQTYYVNTSSSGSGDGTTQQLSGPHAAWKNINEISGLLPGDSVLFHRGDIWATALYILVSGEPGNVIIFGAYGSGEDPLIDVSTNIYGVPAIGLFGTDYLEIKNFRLKGSGGSAAFMMAAWGEKDGSGAMGDGYTVVVRDVNVLSNIGVSEGNHDGFSLHATYPDGSSQALFYNISAADCRNATLPYGSHQSFTAHERCKAKVYTANFIDGVSWYAGTQGAQVEFYDLTAIAKDCGGIVITGGATSENYCLISDSNLLIDGAGRLFFVGSGASLDSPGIIIQDSNLTSLNGHSAINHGNITLLRNVITVDDPGWKFSHVNGRLLLQDNTFYCGDTADWASLFHIYSSAYATVSGNVFNIGTMDFSVFFFKDGSESDVNSEIANNIFNNVSGCNSVIKIEDDAYAPSIYNNVFYNSSIGGKAIDIYHDGDESNEKLVNIENNIFYNVADVVNDSAGGDYFSGYNCFYQSEFIDGFGSITADPLFVDAEAGDFHLKSQGWRQDVQRQIWTWDDVTSRCLDAGNPGRSLDSELLSVPPDPGNIWGQNLRINIGAYGGTNQASIPPYDWSLCADADNDGTVNFVDLDRITSNWLVSGSELTEDLNRDGIVNLADFALLANEWLKETSWH
jgi:hypothetical protein